MGLREKLRGRKVYFDANVFIYLMEGFAAFAADISDIGESLLHTEAEFFTSELTLCEVLVLPFRQNDTSLIARYRSLIEESGSFGLLPTRRETYVRASLFRGQFAMKTSDAIHMASAAEAGCQVFVTADRGIKAPRGIEVVALEKR